MKKGILISIIALSLCTPALAFEGRMELELGTTQGHNTYQIGGPAIEAGSVVLYHWPISELRFPVDTNMMHLRLAMAPVENLFIGAEMSTSIAEGSERMRDVDWYHQPLNNIDSYSKSKSDLWNYNAELSIDYKIDLGNHFAVSLGGGYRYQNYDYEIGDTYLAQRDLVDPSVVGSGYIFGKVLTYDVIYRIPYVQLGLQTNWEKFSAGIEVGYGPSITAEDRDNHVLRLRISRSETDGDAIFGKIRAQYDIHDQLYLFTNFSYMQIETEGEQVQQGIGSSGGSLYFYQNTIDTEITSDQASFGIGLGMKF